MSAYGKTVYNPYEQSAQWVEKIKREEKLKKQHKVLNGEGAVIDTYFKGVKPDAGPDPNKEISYFNNYKQVKSKGMYERAFTVEHDYNPKLHRDDRQHNVGMDLHGEDEGKKSFMRSNSVYGKRAPIDPMGRANEHAMVQVIAQEFFDHGPKVRQR